MESVTSNKDYLNLDGRIVLITGARGQLGRELTKTFLSMGSIVVATDILDSNEDNIKHENYKYFQLDITNRSEVRDVFEEVFSEYKTVDILVNNAGVSTFKNSKDRTENDLDFVIGVNLKGTFFCIQTYVSLLESNQNEGNIINTASHYGLISPDFRIYTDCDRRNSEIYGATKAGIIQMTKYFAVELAPKGIRSNSVSPGGIYNPDNPQGDDFVNNYSDRTPVGRMADVSEITGAYVYLASNISSYTTGQNIIIDGGMSAW